MTEGTIHDRMSAIMEEARSLGKTGHNAAQHFDFRGVDAVVNLLGPLLRKHGVIVTPELLSHDFANIEVGQNRSLVGHVLVTVAYTFHAPDGSCLTASVIGEAMDSGDKAGAKAMSVAFRTALLQAFALPTEEVDPDATSFERAKPDTPRQDAKRAAKEESDDGVDASMAAHPAGKGGADAVKPEADGMEGEGADHAEPSIPRMASAAQLTLIGRLCEELDEANPDTEGWTTKDASGFITDLKAQKALK